MYLGRLRDKHSMHLITRQHLPPLGLDDWDKEVVDLPSPEVFKKRVDAVLRDTV